MEDNGHKYIHKLIQLVKTLKLIRNCPIDLIPKIVRNSDFVSIRWIKQLRKIRKSKSKNGDKFRISIFDWPFRDY